MFEDVTKNSTLSEERKQRARLKKKKICFLVDVKNYLQCPVEEKRKSVAIPHLWICFKQLAGHQHNVIIGTGREGSMELVTLARFHYLRICPNQLEGEGQEKAGSQRSR